MRLGPVAPGLQMRRRLLTQLDRALDGGVVVVSAGAGYGKTCLVASWADQYAGKVDLVWAGASESDDVPDIGGAGEALAERTRTLRRRGVIVVDDPIRDWPSPTIDRLVTYLAAAPRDLAVIVCTQDGRTQPWAWLQATGRLTLLTARDLRFDEDEAEEFLRASFGLSLPPEVSATVNEHAEGWAEGLRMAGEELRRRDGDPSVVRSWSVVSPRALDRFMADEVVATMSPEDLEVAEIASELPSVDPLLCDHLTGRDDSTERLERFVLRNLFTEHAAEPPGTYRFHPLFAGSLSRMGRKRAPDAMAAALRAASDWYLGAGDTDRAVEAALRAQDGVRAANLLRAIAGSKLRNGEAGLLVSWLERMPQADLWQDPALALALARACGLAGDTLTPRAVLRATEPQMAKLTDPPPGLLIARAQLEASARGWEGRLATMGDPLRDVPDTLGPLADDPILEMCAIDETALANSRVRALIVTGRLEEAVRATGAVITPAEIREPNRYTIVWVGLRAVALAWSGQEALAREAVRQGMRVLRRYHGMGTDALWLHVASAWVADAEDALPSLGLVQGYAATSGLPYRRALATLSACALHLRLGDLPDAARALVAARREVGSLPEPAFLAVLLERFESDPRVGSQPTDELTPQEVAMLRLLASGATRTRIAQSTSYSVNTVKTYLRSAYRKLGAADRDQAVAAAVARGIVDADAVAATEAE